MSLVVDASVILAAARETERGYEASDRFLAGLATLKDSVYCPALVIPECAGAMARTTDRAEMGRRLVSHLKRIPCIQFVPVALALADSAAEIASTCRLRGSDACYVALAKETGAALITWDREMLERGAKVVRTCTPTEWLREQPEQ